VVQSSSVPFAATGSMHRGRTGTRLAQAFSKTTFFERNAYAAEFYDKYVSFFEPCSTKHA
jgi:hypothetical protein